LQQRGAADIVTGVLANRPAAVIFDMDGLLLDTERISRASMIEVMLAMGYPMTEAIFETLIGVPADGNRRLLRAEFGDDFDYELMRQRQRILDSERYGLSRPLRPGARRIVETVAGLGLPCAVATSSVREKTLSHLTHTGLLQFMNAVITRDDVARGKPSPDLYLAAAAALDTPPAACLALEDSYAGVQAAHAARVPVIMVPDLLPPNDAMRSLCLAIVPGLDVVTDWLTAS
jgi:HAD superfamily hydrolase (TIGR01509 family)